MHNRQKKKDISEKHIFLFRQAGLIFALLLVISAFRWTVYERSAFTVEPDLQIHEEPFVADVTKQAPRSKPESGPPEWKPADNATDPPAKKNPEIPDEKHGQNNVPFFIDPPPEKTGQDDGEIHVGVEEEPSFPGGSQALARYISESIVYPETAIKRGIQGRVIVTFVVEPDGSISEVQVREDAGVHHLLEMEAKRIVAEMPTWIPGKQQNRPVRVRVNLPVQFRLF